MILKYFVNDSEIVFNNFQRLFNDFEMFVNDLSSSSKNFGSGKTYKGGRGALASRPPPCRFFNDPKLFRLVFKSLKFIQYSLKNLSKS